MSKLWLRRVQVSPETITSLRLTPFEPVRVCCQPKACSDSAVTFSNTVEMILEVIPSIAPTPTQYDPLVESSTSIIQMHPIVQEFMLFSSNHPECWKSYHDRDVFSKATYEHPDPGTVPVICETSSRFIVSSDNHNSLYLTSKICWIKRVNNLCMAPSTHDESGEKILLTIRLKFICCANEEYDDHLHAISFPCSMKKDDGKHPVEKELEYKKVLEEIVRDNIGDAVVKVGSIVPVCLPSLQSSFDKFNNDDTIAFFFVQNCIESADFQWKDGDINDRCYRLPSAKDLKIEIITESELYYGTNDNNRKLENYSSIRDEDYDSSGHYCNLSCPGYEDLIEEVLSLCNISTKEGSPSGVLIVGPHGVGKTQLGLTIAQKLSVSIENTGGFIKVVNTKDLIHAAGMYNDEARLLAMFAARTAHEYFRFERIFRPPSLLVIDDLDALFEDHELEEGSTLAFERRFALNTIVKIIKKIATLKHQLYISSPVGDRKQIHPFILGFFRADSKQVPPQLARVGLFEKIIHMSTPTEFQRQLILNEILNNLNLSSEGIIHQQNRLKPWSITLASQTAGCVAADLTKLCADALTRSNSRHNATNSLDREGKVLALEWDDLKETARICMPSQLDQLDVTVCSSNTWDIDTSNSMDKWRKIHELSWMCLGGYHEMKAKIYRSVERPWRHHIYTPQEHVSALESQIASPRGVIFYGSSGNGKSQASQCLASSLGLNVVRIKAENILDQWLGGAENAIRSLFSRARSAAPCIIFIDDIDALAGNREDDSGGSCDVHSRILSTLLNEMDGISNSNTKENLLVVATTSHIKDLDSALLRHGRLEEHLCLDNPSLSDIKEIMGVYLEKVPMDQDVQLELVASKLEELSSSGADVQGFCTRACMHAMSKINENDKICNIRVSMIDFEESFHSY